MQDPVVTRIASHLERVAAHGVPTAVGHGRYRAYPDRRRRNTGLSVATALHRHGFHPDLVERSTAWPAIGAGIGLPANGVRVLRALGLGEAVYRAAAEVRRWGFFDQQGKLLCQTDLRDLWREVGPWLGITRVKLQEALLTGAAAVPHRLSVALTALTQNDGTVEVRFSDGTSGSYDLVIGADGIRSTVRELAIASSPPAMLDRWLGEASSRHARQPWST